MSSKNNRVKRLEKKVDKYIKEQDDEILRLDEENSNLRQVVEILGDCLKESNTSLWWEIEIHNGRFRFQRTQILELKATVESEKEKLIQVTGAVMDQGVDIEKVQESALGRFLFKKNGKER